MGELILLVEDNTDILTVLKANLQLHGFEVETASSCQEARQSVQQRTPDLVVLDRMLPDGDGLDLCRLWTSNNSTLPVIMLTARDSVSDRVFGLESGADDYVIKPFDPMELVARIRACLRRTRPDSRERLIVGDLEVDKVTMKATLRGSELELTHKEYQLLCLFMEHPGEVISRDRIKREIWKDTRIYSWSRVIDVHIQHLRRKVEQNPSSPELIRTVIGVGYKMEAP